MPTIYTASTDGRILKRAFTASGDNWSTARDATSGTSASSTITNNSNGAGVLTIASRSGFISVTRSFFAFDTSSITANVASATINIFGRSASTGDIIGVKATKPDLSTNLATADFDAITGFSAGSSMSGNVTDYTAEVTSWSTSGYNAITLTGDALADLKNNNVFSICFVQYDNDYLNSDPLSGGDIDLRVGMYYQDYTGTSRDPYIDFTLATGYGNAVCGVASANIAAVDGVLTANISKVSGV